MVTSPVTWPFLHSHPQGKTHDWAFIHTSLHSTRLSCRNFFIIYSLEIETQEGRVHGCLCFLDPLESQEEREQ